MGRMASHPRRKRLAIVVQKHVIACKDIPRVAARDVATRAAPDARPLMEADVDGWIVARLIPIARRMLGHNKAPGGERGIQPVLCGFEDITLPPRIAVPPEEPEEDEEDEAEELDEERVLFVRLIDATLPELARHLKMLRVQVEGTQAEIRVREAVYRECVRVGAAEDDDETSIGDILGTRREAA